MASPRQEQSQHEMMNQMIQMSEELSYEKKVQHQLLCCITQLEELQHLIFHNQNVDGAVALNQQCMAKEKEAQATEMQDWKQS